MKHRPIFNFILSTGCRTSEAGAFRRKDIRKDPILFAVTFGRKSFAMQVLEAGVDKSRVSCHSDTQAPA
jgi:hypothetical protein